ncbi:MAG: AraC family transcriptional regulator [Clostridia bacterium]|nr:AraC family transcriptional regulator [Clostridia bacterium]
MYSVNGAFGEVRLAHQISKRENPSYFFVSSVGWHKCNELYRVQRPNGDKRHLIIATVGGCGWMSVNGKEYNLPRGSIALIPRNMAHAYKTPTGGLWEFYWLHPDGLLSELFLDTVAENGIFFSKTANDYANLMEKLLSLSLNDSDGNDIAISNTVSEVFHLVAKNLISPHSPHSLSDSVVKYIKEHYGEKISVREIADSLFVSENHLIRVFKKDMGVTPHKYLNDYRILTSAYFLKSSNMSVEEIADIVGFSTSSLFITTFKSVYGCTPKEYRKKHFESA